MKSQRDYCFVMVFTNAAECCCFIAPAWTQIDYVMDCLRQTLGVLPSSTTPTVEVTRTAQQRYNAWLQARFPSTIWASGCASWYVNSKSGKNFTLWPGFTFSFAKQLRYWDRRCV